MSGILHALAIRYGDDDMATFNRVVGMLRRRQIKCHTMTAAPLLLETDVRMTVVFEATPEEAERLALVFRNVIGIEEANVYQVQDTVSREIALITIEAASDRAELLDTLQLYGATIVEEGPAAVVAEINGSAAWVLSCLRALERFHITDVARSGAVSVPRVTNSTGSPA